MVFEPLPGKDSEGSQPKRMDFESIRKRELSPKGKGNLFWMERGLKSAQVLAGGSQGELPVLDPFGADQPVADFFDLSPLAFHHQDFQAIVFIQVNMQGGQDGFVMIVLHLGQNAGKFTGMV